MRLCGGGLLRYELLLSPYSLLLYSSAQSEKYSEMGYKTFQRKPYSNVGITIFPSR